MKFANVRELKSQTSEMLRTVERGNTVLVTTHARPTAMLVPVTEDDIEDALLAYNPHLRKKIEEGLKDIRAGRSTLLLITTRRAKKRSYAQRDLDTFPDKVIKQILSDCTRLANDPIPDGKRIKKLQG